MLIIKILCVFFNLAVFNLLRMLNSYHNIYFIMLRKPHNEFEKKTILNLIFVKGFPKIGYKLI